MDKEIDLASIKELKPECTRCGDCCRQSPIIQMENIDLDKGDPQGLIQYYRYHGVTPLEKMYQGKRILALQIPLQCVYFEEKTNLCQKHDQRPNVCRDFFCEKIIKEALKK